MKKPKKNEKIEAIRKTKKNILECELCGNEFSCEMATGHCWCMDLPPIDINKPSEQCICPDCLKSQVNS